MGGGGRSGGQFAAVHMAGGGGGRGGGMFAVTEKEKGQLRNSRRGGEF